ncbi:NirD/YgiW/YdeI family stress tolerance protein [Vibrio sp. 404]|uniref:NirD/YgiW/YdeI family stress tolerance protein n=1 Tax=Vibrio marinisediminis TaxID=2758441 RepID=A0A7W2IUV8_9VIBR|nr:NirD/YgiW/YdeI family stress tolerance protein [Vibrio marinisediminis]MBA5763986.1 NirD/YgiW/YdeI family stress tolerance protein [Vibrio marinisediminis]
MKKIIAAAVLILAPTIALAGGDQQHNQNMIQYKGPVELTNLTNLLADSSMFTEQKVVLEGKLIRQLDHENFIFSDGESEVRVELDDDIVLKQTLDATTQVRLFGEFEGGSTPEIEVDRIQVL